MCRQSLIYLFPNKINGHKILIWIQRNVPDNQNNTNRTKTNLLIILN